MRNSLGFFTTFLVCLLGATGQADITYELLLESNDDLGAGSEVFMTSFDSYSDLLSGNVSSGLFSQLNLGSNFSVGGLAFDGSQYQLLLESDDDRGAGSEIFMGSFASYSDLLNGNLINGQFSQLNLGSNFSAGGLAFDGSQYQLLLESDDDRGAGSEIFMGSFASYSDLLNGNLINGQFSQLNIASSFSAGGLVARANAVPEPSALATSLLMGLLLVRRRCRKEDQSE